MTDSSRVRPGEADASITGSMRDDPVHQAELDEHARAPLDWARLDGSTVMVTGATGLIGSYLVDLLLARNRATGAGTRVVATGRRLAALQERFDDPRDRSHLELHEVRGEADSVPPVGHVDAVVHGASNARPASLQRDPVGTLMGNLRSTDAVLRAALESGDCRVLLLSSSEVYGPTAGPSPLAEGALGPLDILKPRASYPVAKRAAETLCVSYQAQHGTWAAITRPAYVYGPTAAPDDDRVVPQLLDQALRDGAVTLASDGSLRRSYCYVGDCVTGLLTVLTRGASGQAYNIADPGSVATVRQVAGLVAELTGAQVHFRDPAHAVATGSRDQGVLDPGLLMGLGWAPRTGLPDGLARTLAARKRWAPGWR